MSRINPQLAPAHASLSDARGGAWTGSGELRVNGTPLGRLSWDTSFWPLITGHLDARMRLRGNDIKAHALVNAASKSVQVTRLQGQASLQMLARLANLPPDVQGTLVADIKTLRLSGRGIVQAVKGTVDIHGTRLPDLGVDLGTLHLTLQGSGGNNAVHGVIDNSGGDLDISGQLNLFNGVRYNLVAYLKPHPGSKNDPMRDALAAILGKPDAQGRYHYNATGRLNP